MAKAKPVNKSFTQLTNEGLAVVRKNLIEQEKKKKGYFVVSDEKGKIKKIPASKL